jgi:hypothetical protein
VDCIGLDRDGDDRGDVRVVMMMVVVMMMMAAMAAMAVTMVMMERRRGEGDVIRSNYGAMRCDSIGRTRLGWSTLGWAGF